MHVRILPLLALPLALAIACGGDDDDDVASVDAAAAIDATAGAPDAREIDAAPPADAAVCTETLLVTADGSTVGLFDIVISEISIAGDYVELFNITDTDVALSGLTTHKWCAFPNYAAVSADTVTVPAGGFATIPFPIGGQTEAAGELVLYSDDSYTTPGSVLDYLCWGTGGTMRKATAETANKWSGGCVDAIPTGGAIHRNQDEEGDVAGDYTANGTQTPMSCVAP